MDIMLITIVLVFIFLLLLKPNVYLTKAVWEWPALSVWEKLICLALLWFLPGVGHYLAYKKSGLDKSFSGSSNGSIPGDSGTDGSGGSGGSCGDGGC